MRLGILGIATTPLPVHLFNLVLIYVLYVLLFSMIMIAFAVPIIGFLGLTRVLYSPMLMETSVIVPDKVVYNFN